MKNERSSRKIYVPSSQKAMHINKEQYFILRKVLHDIGVNFVVTYESEDMFIRMLNDGLFRIKENELFSDKGK